MPRCSDREVFIMRKSCQVIVGNPLIGQGLRSPQLWGPRVISNVPPRFRDDGTRVRGDALSGRVETTPKF